MQFSRYARSCMTADVRSMKIHDHPQKLINNFECVFEKEITTETLQHYLKLLSVEHSKMSASEIAAYGRMAETIRHLIFLRQTEQSHNDMMASNRNARIVAGIAAVAVSLQVLIQLLEWICPTSR